MDWINNILCVSKKWLVDDEKIIGQSNYDKLRNNGTLKAVTKNAPGNPVYISYESIPERFKSMIKERYGDPYKNTKLHSFSDYLTPDGEALSYYSGYRLNDGRPLPPENVEEYCANAMILNAVHHVVNNRAAKRRSLGGRKQNIWEKVLEEVEQIRAQYKHTLPANLRRFREKYDDYKNRGYEAIIHKGFCNTNRRKVFDDLERLLVSLSVMPNKPYAKTVHELYMLFLANSIEVPDLDSGELYQPEQFYQDGEPVMVSPATVWNIMNKPVNKALIASVRSNPLEYNNLYVPHHNRHNAQFSLSKVSMDDRDLPRKMADGTRVKSYVAYDVASRAIVGVAYSKNKTTELFLDCMRNMFFNLSRYGLGTPMEVEVEHHLVNTFKEGLMKAQILFPFVRWCNPGNSQEKYAEVMHRDKKYGFEKKYQDGVGRFYAKQEANRPKTMKVFDEKNNTYREKTYTFEQIIADDLMIIREFNNSEHPKYPGKRRIDILLENQNKNVANIDRPLLARYIGFSRETSIRRSMYVTVEHAKYMLESPTVMSLLKPNNYKVMAYYIPEPDGTIESVFLYQDEVFISECKKIATYVNATAEFTEQDLQNKEIQAAYVKEYRDMIKGMKPAKVTVIRNDFDYDDVEALPVPAQKELAPVMTSGEFDFNPDDDDYYAQIALNNI